MTTRSSISSSKPVRFRWAAALAAGVFLLAFYVALGRLYSYAAGQNKVNIYNKQRFDEFYAAPSHSIDWFFVGSSHAYCTFDPENFDALGVSSFQMGMPLQLLDSTYYTLLEILEYQQPDTLVLDLYWYVLEKDFEAKQMDTLFQVWQNNALKKQYLNEVLPLTEKVKYYLTPVRYQADFFAYVNNKLLNVINYRFGLRKTVTHNPGDEYYKGRGYVYYDYVMTDRQYREISSQPVRDMYGWRMAASQAKYLDRITALCAEKEIKLILVTAPVSNVQFSRLKNYSAFHEQIAEYADRHGLAYLDYNQVNAAENLFADDCFFDAGHLNDRGVKIADAYFIKWLGY